MSLEESDDTIATTAFASPAPEQTENEQPPVAIVATAVPAATTATTATAIPAASTELDSEDETEANAIEHNSGEEKVEEKPESEPPTSKPAQTPPPPPPQRQQDAYFHKPPAPQLPYPSFLYDTFLMLFILIGMVFILIGGILSGTAIISKNIDVYGASLITSSLGLFTISTFLILAALFRNDLNTQIRLGFLIIGAFSILGLVLYSSQSY